jgi:hypothetical protein
MRLSLITIVTLSLGAGATLGQTGTGSSPLGPAPVSSQLTPASLTTYDRLPPLRLLARPAPSLTSPARVADCMRMWDFGTHMTKQEWSRTCTRVQDRLENLDLNLIPPKKTEFTGKEQRNSKGVLRDWRS